MNLRIITKNHAADSKIGYPFKIDSRADWTHESIPTAWEVICGQLLVNLTSSSYFPLVHDIQLHPDFLLYQNLHKDWDLCDQLLSGDG